MNFGGTGFTLTQILIAGAIFLIGITMLMALILLIVRLVKKRGQLVEVAKPNLAIDVQRLPQTGTEGLLHQLGVYSTPVRLAVLVVAPKGHSMQLPNRDQLRILLERITPGLGKVFDEHRPVYREWPAQMSMEGFAHAFTNNVQLPGNEGRGTPWYTGRCLMNTDQCTGNGRHK